MPQPGKNSLTRVSATMKRLAASLAVLSIAQFHAPFLMTSARQPMMRLPPALRRQQTVNVSWHGCSIALFWFTVMSGLLAHPGQLLYGQPTIGMDKSVVMSGGTLGRELPLRAASPAAARVSALDQARPPANLTPWRTMSASSCAAASCHNGPRPGIAAPQAPRGSEYSLWRENDPHARAHQALCSQQGLAMLAGLNILQNGRIVDHEQYNNCLKCHNTFPGDAEACCGDQPHAPEGVGCESCHGPSAQWIDRHYLRDWDPAGEFDQGYIPLDDLVTRARVCAQCHVGDDDRDMNHDLIAAGHPTLRFEFATYHARLPKHWREPAVEDASRFEAQLWLAGQIASLDAALALLESRASRAATSSAWPEFSEYTCAACHHDLQVTRRLTDAAAVVPAADFARASLRYSTWYTAGVRMILQAPMTIDPAIEESRSSIEAEQLRASLDHVKSLMQSATRPDSADTATAARTARADLRRWLAEQQAWRFQWNAQQLAQSVIDSSRSEQVTETWEAAAQFYLAAVACRASWPGGLGGAVATHAVQLRQSLDFEPGQAASAYPYDRSPDARVSHQELTTILKSLAEALAQSDPELQ